MLSRNNSAVEPRWFLVSSSAGVCPVSTCRLYGNRSTIYFRFR